MSYNPGQSPYDPGQSQPPTMYAPPPPPLLRKKSRRWLWVSLVLLVLVIAGAVATTLILTNPARAVNTVVQNYYNAVEQQDYSTAYTYVDSQSYQSVGQHIRLGKPEYTLVSRTTDLTEGKLTAYTISDIEVDGSTATVTVNATRGGTVRVVTVHLQDVDSTWEIDAIGQN
jgi:hypothetical protein